MYVEKAVCSVAGIGTLVAILLVLVAVAPAGAAVASEAAVVEAKSHQDLFLRSRGYGKVLEVVGDEVTLYQETASSRLRLREGRIEGDWLKLYVDEDEDGNPIPRILVPFGTIRQEGDTVVVEEPDRTVYVLDPIPGLSQREITGPTDDPVANFQVFWEVLEENSSYFTLTGIDWHAVYAQYRPQVTAQTTEEELFDILTAMVWPLQDGHLTINGRRPDRQFVGRPPSPSAWMTTRFEELRTAVESHLDGGQVHAAVDGLIYYGTINGTIGYLVILGYWGYAADRLEDALAEQASFEAAIDGVLAGFSPLEALIIDIRLNAGGLGNLALALASRLTDRARLGFSVQARIGGYDEFAPPTPAFFGPEGVQFLNRPVLLLTSNNTESAAEVQAMLLKSLPNVRLVGETTYGIFSATLEAGLPNGWRFAISNERRLSPEVPPRDYERIGISPHIPVLGSQTALDQGRDNILERALQALEPGPDCEGAKLVRAELTKATAHGNSSDSGARCGGRTLPSPSK